MAVILSFIFLVVVAMAPLATGVDRGDLIKSGVTLILSSMAYVFGAVSGRR